MSLAHHSIELRDHLLGCLEAWLPTIKRWDVTELTAIGAATRELHAPDEVGVEWDQVVGGKGKIAEGEALGSLEEHLLWWRPDALIQAGDEPVCGIAEFPNVKVVEVRVGVGRS
jgi:hypothetical protein